MHCSWARAQGHVSIPQQADQLQTQLQLVEDARSGVRQELIEMHRQLREGEEARERQRQEMLGIRRAMGDETREKEALQKSNTELRAVIKKTESERIR